MVWPSVRRGSNRQRPGEGRRDLESGAVEPTPVRPSARALLDQRDALLQEPGFQAELEALFEGLRDTRPAEPVEFP